MAFWRIMQAFLEVFLTKYELCLYLFLPGIPINRVSSRPLYPQANEDQSHRQRNAVDTERRIDRENGDHR